MDVVVWGIFAGAMAIAISTYWARHLRIRRALRAAPRATVADAREGALVRLDGKVVGAEPLVAPLTGRPCVYYVAIVESWHRSKKRRWVERVREERSVGFAIDDGTGRAVIDLTGTRLDIELDGAFKTGTFEDGSVDAIAPDFVERHALRQQSWFGGRTRYREGVIAIGETIAIAGRSVREPDPDAAARATGYRDALATRLRLGGSTRHPLLISDAREVTR